MKTLYALAVAAAIPLAVYAQGIPTPPTSQSIMKEAVIELKDGGKILHSANGSMYHVNEKGQRLPFMTGKMEAKDGSVYWMKNGYVWQLIAKGENPHNSK